MSTDVLLKIKAYLVAHPDVAQDQSRWIIGAGWNNLDWPGGEFPSAVCAATDFRQIFVAPSLFVFSAKDDLDREPLLRGRSVLLDRVDYHTCWVSNAILSKLNNLPDEVEGGRIVRDHAGKPTGSPDFSLVGCIFFIL